MIHTHIYIYTYNKNNSLTSDQCHNSGHACLRGSQPKDTDKYFVVIVNLLGNGFSSSPGCAEYPADGTSMCDNVRLQALLLDSLGISEIACIYGYSMGAMHLFRSSYVVLLACLRLKAIATLQLLGVLNKRL